MKVSWGESKQLGELARSPDHVREIRGIALGLVSALVALVLYLLVPTAFIVALVSFRGRNES